MDVLIQATMSIVKDSYDEGEIGNIYDHVLPLKLANNVQTIEDIAQAYSDYLPDRNPEQLDTNMYQWTYLGDQDNLEASQVEIEEWKHNRKDLYQIAITLELHKLTEATL